MAQPNTVSADLSHLEHDPFFTFIQAYATEDLPQTIRFDTTTATGRRMRADIHPYSGEQSFEVLIGVTIAESLVMQKEHSLGNGAIFQGISRCLTGSAKTAREEVLDEHFPDETVARVTANMDKAIKHLYAMLLNCCLARDVMWRWLMSSQAKKDPVAPCNVHLRRFKQVWCMTLQLPKGSSPRPPMT